MSNVKAQRSNEIFLKNEEALALIHFDIHLAFGF
jgi:hypothetical protein